MIESLCFSVLKRFSVGVGFGFSLNGVFSSGGGYIRLRLEKANKEMLTGNKCCNYIGFKDYFKP